MVFEIGSYVRVLCGTYAGLTFKVILPAKTKTGWTWLKDTLNGDSFWIPNQSLELAE